MEAVIIIHALTPSVPMSALLSQALVAFTIEFDNEMERRMPHRTTDYGPAGSGPIRPWLVSLAMWFNCLEHLGDDGLTAKELELAARTKTNLNGMERWGYVTITREGRDQRVRATAAGRMAQGICRPLLAEIEERWHGRFGAGKIGDLRRALLALVVQFDVDLPDCMPILGYGLTTRTKDDDRRPAARPLSEHDAPPLPAMLARTLVAFALLFERDSSLSLAIHSDVLRVVPEDGVLLRDLPALGGVSKEAVAGAMKILKQQMLASVGADPRVARVKRVALTTRGRAAQEGYLTRVRAIDTAWRRQFGGQTIDALRRALEDIVRPDAERPPLLEGFAPCPECWRARVPAPVVLPHFPMVLHRGGYPDGA